MIGRGERNGREEGKTKERNESDVYLDPTKSNLSRFHSLILSKSKVVVSRTQDLHIPWGGGEGKGGKGEDVEEARERAEREERRERKQRGGKSS